MRDPLIGTRIDRYELRESVQKSDVIGVYKAYDTKLERHVLIKTILHSSEYSPEAVNFFMTEARSLAKLAHPNIAKVLDFGHANGNLYLISEFVAGQSLSDLMNHPMPWQRVINILLPLTQALIYAHSRGIIHRDLRPDNIIINSDDQPILSDFSLMRIIEDEETRDMTGTNVGLGSPAYISPEQGSGLSVDFRSDIYSLGVIFFEMVTGKKLFYATSSMEIVIQHIMADPPRPRSIIPHLPKMVEAIILRALSKDREKRYQTMEEFSNAMKAVIEAANQQQTQTTRVPPRLVGLVIGALVLAVLVIGFVVRPKLSATPSQIPSDSTVHPTTTKAILTSTPQPDTPTPTSSALPPSLEGTFADFQLPALPVLSGNGLPASHQAINPNNVTSIQELARWGNPIINQLGLINGDQVILAATSAGMYYLDPKDLSAKAFFDSGGSVSVFTISQDGKWVATADNHGMVAVWNLADGQQLYQFQKDGLEILALDFSPDKSKLVFSDKQKNIYLWNVIQNQTPYPFHDRLNANKLLFTSDGNTVISGGDNFQVTFWDAAKGVVVDQFAAAQKINDMAISSDGKYLALAMNDARVQIWDLPTQTVVNQIHGPEYGIQKPFTSITFVSNDTNILTGSADGFIRTWNALVHSEYIWETTSSEPADTSGGISPIKSVAVASSGTKVIVGYESGRVEIWDRTTQKVDISKDLSSHPVTRLVISPDDRILAIQGGESFVEILSVQNDSQRVRIHGTLPRGNPISPDNQMIGIQDRDLNLYPLSALVAPTAPLFALHDYPARSFVGFSSDSRIVAASSGANLFYWSTVSGQQLKAHRLISDGRCRVIFRLDDQFLAAGSENGVILSDKNLDYFCHVSRDPRAISEDFLPDGSIIAVSLQNRRLDISDAHQEDPKTEFTLDTPGDVLDVALSSDGKLLAAASSGGTIEIFNLATMKRIKILPLRTGPIHHLLFSNNREYLIAGLADGTLRFFGLHP